MLEFILETCIPRTWIWFTPLTDSLKISTNMVFVSIQSMQEYVPDTFGLAIFPNRDVVGVVVFGVVGEDPTFGVGDGKCGTGGNCATDTDFLGDFLLTTVVSIGWVSSSSESGISRN